MQAVEHSDLRLLVNVGCHSDAHEQARWFGDDIALKADKHTYEQRSVQAVVATMRKLGSGNPPHILTRPGYVHGGG